MSLVLIGPRGSGKSTVGRILANQLGWAFVDLDLFIVERAGRTIRDLFETDGEPRFRDLESHALAEVAQRPRTVLAVGGGAVLRPENRTVLRGMRRVWLRAAPEVLVNRAAADPQSASNRPPLTPLDPLAEMQAVLSQRDPIYRDLAELTIDTDMLDPAAIAAKIAAWLAAQADSTSGLPR